MRTHQIVLNDNQIRVIMHALAQLDLPTVATLATVVALEHDELDPACALPFNLAELFNDTLNVTPYDRNMLHSFVL